MAYHVPHLHLPRLPVWSWSEQELTGLLVTLLILAIMLVAG